MPKHKIDIKVHIHHKLNFLLILFVDFQTLEFDCQGFDRCVKGGRIRDAPRGCRPWSLAMIFSGTGSGLETRRIGFNSSGEKVSRSVK